MLTRHACEKSSRVSLWDIARAYLTARYAGGGKVCGLVAKHVIAELVHPCEKRVCEAWRHGGLVQGIGEVRDEGVEVGVGKARIDGTDVGGPQFEAGALVGAAAYCVHESAKLVAQQDGINTLEERREVRILQDTAVQGIHDTFDHFRAPQIKVERIPLSPPVLHRRYPL